MGINNIVAVFYRIENNIIFEELKSMGSNNSGIASTLFLKDSNYLTLNAIR